MRGRSLDLTYKEFELLKYLAQHPGRVFSRAQLLQEVWGYDYFGGTRTVDVHVRRLRAKLGAEHEQLIGTVRNVGYRFVPPATTRERQRRERASTPPARPDCVTNRRMSPPEKWRRLSSAGLAEVPELLDAAEQADGVRPVSEQAELVLRHPRDSAVHIGVIGKDAKLLGYAQVDTSVLPATVEGAVHPAHRRAGIGALLRDGAEDHCRTGRFAGLGARRAPGRPSAGGVQRRRTGPRAAADATAAVGSRRARAADPSTCPRGFDFAPSCQVRTSRPSSR